MINKNKLVRQKKRIFEFTAPVSKSHFHNKEPAQFIFVISPDLSFKSYSYFFHSHIYFTTYYSSVTRQTNSE